MDIKQWNTRTIPLSTADGEEAFVIVRPLTVEWSARAAEAEIERAEEPEGATGAERAAARREFAGRLLGFFEPMVRDLVVGFRGVTIGGEEASTEQILDALCSDENQLIALGSLIIRSGQIGPDEGKD